MKRTLITLLGITAVIVVFSEYFVRLSQRSPNEPNPHGPLKLSLVGMPARTNQATRPQLEARALLLLSGPPIRDRGFQSDTMFRLVNTGRGLVSIHGFNPSAPEYRIELKRQGKWLDLPMTDARRGLKEPLLQGGDILEFPVITPEGAESWRIYIIYTEYVSSTLLSRFIDGVLRCFNRPARPRVKRYIVRNEEIPL